MQTVEILSMIHGGSITVSSGGNEHGVVGVRRYDTMVTLWLVGCSDLIKRSARLPAAMST